jgi:hypothetical protein
VTVQSKRSESFDSIVSTTLTHELLLPQQYKYLGQKKCLDFVLRLLGALAALKGNTEVKALGCYDVCHLVRNPNLLQNPLC